MSKEEIIGKVLSCLLWQNFSAKCGKDRAPAVSYGKILNIGRYADFRYDVDGCEIALVRLLEEACGEMMPRFNNLIVKDKNISIELIESDIRNRMENGLGPVVIIDYLQILKTNGKQGTDKQIMDYKLEKLLEIRDLTKKPLIVVSSFNRDS